MRYLLTSLLCVFTLSLTAQETITYPYNPDANSDTFVAVSDLQSFLTVFGSAFSPAEIMIGDTTLYNWLQLMNQTLLNQQSDIDSLHANISHGYQNILGDSVFIVPNGVNTLYINLIGAAGGNGQGSEVYNGSVLQYNINGCAGGYAMSADLILSCNSGDSILIDFGIDGATLPTQSVNSVYSAGSSNGTNGGVLQVFVNSINILNISGGLGGSGITWCNGMNYSCCFAQNTDGAVTYPAAYNTYPIFVTGSRPISSNLLQNQATIKY